MTDSTLVIPTDLKIEIEERSRKEQRSEADVLRDALRQYAVFHDAGKANAAFARYLEMASNGLLDAPDEATQRPEKPLARPIMPKSFGIASSGSVQTNEASRPLPIVFGSTSNGVASSEGGEGWDTEDHSGDLPWPQSIGMISDGSFDPAEDEQYMKEHWKPDW